MIIYLQISFFWLRWVPCRILVPWLGMKPITPALGVQNLFYFLGSLTLLDNQQLVLIRIKCLDFWKLWQARRYPKYRARLVSLILILFSGQLHTSMGHSLFLWPSRACYQCAHLEFLSPSWQISGFLYVPKGPASWTPLHGCTCEFWLYIL